MKLRIMQISIRFFSCKRQAIFLDNARHGVHTSSPGVHTSSPGVHCPNKLLGVCTPHARRAYIKTGVIAASGEYTPITFFSVLIFRFFFTFTYALFYLTRFSSFFLFYFFSIKMKIYSCYSLNSVENLKVFFF